MNTWRRVFYFYISDTYTHTPPPFCVNPLPPATSQPVVFYNKAEKTRKNATFFYFASSAELKPVLTQQLTDAQPKTPPPAAPVDLTRPNRTTRLDHEHTPGAATAAPMRSTHHPGGMNLMEPVAVVLTPSAGRTSLLTGAENTSIPAAAAPVRLAAFLCLRP